MCDSVCVENTSMSISMFVVNFHILFEKKSAHNDTNIVYIIKNHRRRHQHQHQQAHIARTWIQLWLMASQCECEFTFLLYINHWSFLCVCVYACGLTSAIVFHIFIGILLNRLPHIYLIWKQSLCIIAELVVNIIQ